MRLLHLGALAFGSVLLLACKGAKPKEVVPQKWDGKSTLHCPPAPNGEKNSVTITDCKADLPGYAIDLNHCDVTLVRCDVKGAEYAASINGDATLTLKDSTLRGKVGVSANNESKLVIEGGSVEGKEYALIIENGSTLQLQGGTVRGETGMYVSNGASAALVSGRVEGTYRSIYAFNDRTMVTVSPGVTITGRAVRENRASVTGIPALEREEANERIAGKFGPRVCAMAFACYPDEFGLRTGRYTVDVGADGRVLAATYKGDAPAPVQKCLLDTKGKALAGYDAAPGSIQCAYMAKIGPTSKSLDRKWTYEPK
jgi:hypothetical protein